MKLTTAGLQEILTRSYKYAGITFHSALFSVTPYTATVTPVLSGSTFTSNAHGLVNGVRVGLSSSGTIPSPLLPNIEYFVVSATTNNYQLSATLGGSAISLSTVGAGTITATEVIPGTADPLAVWARHEVAYGGSSRQSLSFSALQPIIVRTGWGFTPQVVRFSPTSASIVYRYMGIIIGGNATRLDTTGHLHSVIDYEFALTIASGTSADIQYTPIIS